MAVLGDFTNRFENCAASTRRVIAFVEPVGHAKFGFDNMKISINRHHLMLTSISAIVYEAQCLPRMEGLGPHT
jgi:hypothetical protein